MVSAGLGAVVAVGGTVVVVDVDVIETDGSGVFAVEVTAGLGAEVTVEASPDASSGVMGPPGWPQPAVTRVKTTSAAHAVARSLGGCDLTRRDLTLPAYLARAPGYTAEQKPMPEMPDIEAYVEALKPRILGRRLLGVRLVSPFLLRTPAPPPDAAVGRRVETVERLGKRIVIGLVDLPGAVSGAGGATPRPGDAARGAGSEAGLEAAPGTAALFLVLHLMIAGRLHWRPPGAAVPRGSGLAAFDFPEGTLVLTEAGKKHRASLHVVQGREALGAFDPGGLEVLGSSRGALEAALRRENHTLKRALTDPRILSGIGNAYSDEILHRARLSPFKQTRALTEDEIVRLHEAAVTVLARWTDRLRAEARDAFPEKVTAFRPEMAVHGRSGQRCPVCGTVIRRIVYAENECDYCPVCQTEGRIFADRSLSRLLCDDWPRHVHEEPRTPVADESAELV